MVTERRRSPGLLLLVLPGRMGEADRHPSPPGTHGHATHPVGDGTAALAHFGYRYRSRYR
jgi:hypothetical protein